MIFFTTNRYDARLFNQSAGMDAGFGAEDGYGVYSKPMFNRGDAQSVYRPKKDDGDAWGDADQQVGVVCCVFRVCFEVWRVCCLHIEPFFLPSYISAPSVRPDSLS